jgi:KipI family sensor histidine kinase inhibitor
VAEWLRLGDRAIRFPRPAGSSSQVLLREIRSWPGVIDVVVAARDVAVYFQGAPTVAPRRLDGLADLGDDAVAPRDITIAAVYDGPDLADVARAARLSEADVVRLHSASAFVVDTIGFAPGFAYLTGLDARLHLPRRETPRTRVPAGSIAVAAGFSAVYPFDSPGGWHLIGHVDGVRMFGDQGALLRIGDHVRFVP